MINHTLALTVLTELFNSKAADSWCEVSSGGQRLVWQELTELLPPRLPPFLLIFLPGVLFHPTQHIVFITLAPPPPIPSSCFPLSLPHPVVTPSFSLLVHKAAYFFDLTIVMIQTVHSDLVLVTMISQNIVVLGKTPSPILFFPSWSFYSLYNLCALTF